MTPALIELRNLASVAVSSFVVRAPAKKAVACITTLITRIAITSITCAIRWC